MHYAQLPGISKPVARIIQGTTMVRSHTQDYSFALLDDIYALGGNTFDAAHVYGDGDVERSLGRWIHSRGLWAEVVVITKGAHHNDDRQRVTPHDISADLFDSLARLNTPAIDLYMLHRDDPTVPVGEIMDALEEHRRAGRIHAIGASNWTHERLQAANAYAQAQGYTPFVASSVQFSLAEMLVEPWPNCISIGGAGGAAARDWYAAAQMPLLAWSSLAAGLFSGRFQRDNLHSFTQYHDQIGAQTYGQEVNFQRYERAALLAQQKGATAAQIALAYVFHQPMNLYALVGCRAAAEFADNIAALDIVLTPQELTWLENGSPEDGPQASGGA